MGDQTNELSKTIGTDTTKLAVGRQEISATIGNKGSKQLDPSQISPSLDKREKELAKNRSCDEDN